MDRCVGQSGRGYRVLYRFDATSCTIDGPRRLSQGGLITLLTHRLYVLNLCECLIKERGVKLSLFWS